MEQGQEVLFDWPEYLVFGSVLASSAAIGIIFGCFGTKNATRDEYLLGNKKMHPIPVALSLLTSYVSSITMLGHPVEIYMYGTQLMVALMCYIPLTLSLIYLFVPFYFNLQMTSVYEYLELRFNRWSRYILSPVTIIYMVFYMALVVYGPALALSQVTGFSHTTLVALMFLVCIFYSSIGGLKAVLWADSLQAIVMFSSMAAVVILGISKVGGISVVWERAEKSGRLIFLNFDPDPRTRHTIWTALIGGYFTWLPMYVNQAQMQRYISLPSVQAVTTSLVINLFGLWTMMGLCYVGGLAMYAQYYNCDPLTNGEILTIDQLLPKFVMDISQDIQGLPGLFVAGITCAGLSTVSSVVNALSAVVVQDYVKQWKSDLSERNLTLISKLVSVIVGLMGFGFVFVAEKIGNIFSAATVILGIFGGPSLGLFILGMFFPWANTLGAISGLLMTFLFMAFLGFGSRYYKESLPSQHLELDISGCLNHTRAPSSFLEFSPLQSWKDEEYNGFIKFFSISDIWYPAIGFIMTVSLGLIFSFLASSILKTKIKRLNKQLFVPLVLKVWIKLFPEQIERLVILDDDKHQHCDVRNVQ